MAKTIDNTHRTVWYAAAICCGLLIIFVQSCGKSPPNGQAAKEGLSGKADVEVNVAFDDPARQTEIRLTRIVRGEAAVKAGLFYEFELEKARAKGADLWYFHLTIKNVAGMLRSIRSSDFTLEDSEDFNHRDVGTQDGIAARVEAGDRVKGGVGFEVPKSARPAKLVFQTGLTSRFATLDLTKLDVPVDIANSPSEAEFKEKVVPASEKQNVFGLQVADLKGVFPDLEGPKTDSDGKEVYQVTENGHFTTSVFIADGVINKIMIDKTRPLDEISLKRLRDLMGKGRRWLNQDSKLHIVSQMGGCKWIRDDGMLEMHILSNSDQEGAGIVIQRPDEASHDQ